MPLVRVDNDVTVFIPDEDVPAYEQFLRPGGNPPEPDFTVEQQLLPSDIPGNVPEAGTDYNPVLVPDVEVLAASPSAGESALAQEVQPVDEYGDDGSEVYYDNYGEDAGYDYGQPGDYTEQAYYEDDYIDQTTNTDINYDEIFPDPGSAAAEEMIQDPLFDDYGYPDESGIGGKLSDLFNAADDRGLLPSLSRGGSGGAAPRSSSLPVSRQMTGGLPMPAYQAGLPAQYPPIGAFRQLMMMLKARFPGITTARIMELVRTFGPVAAAGALGIGLDMLAQIITRRKRRRGRGISARDIRRTKSTLRKVCTISEMFSRVKVARKRCA